MEATDCNTWRPLNWTVKNGHDEVGLLLQFEANTQARTSSRQTPLHYAAK